MRHSPTATAKATSPYVSARNALTLEPHAAPMKIKYAFPTPAYAWVASTIASIVTPIGRLIPLLSNSYITETSCLVIHSYVHIHDY